MRELHVVALSEDGRHVVLATRKGAGRGEFRVAVDDRLSAAVRGELPRPGEEVLPEVTPKDIQARLRAGESVEQIAMSAGMPAARVERFAGPVFSERERMINGARAATVNRTRRGPSGLALGDAVDQHLAQAAGYRPESTTWSARREETGRWLVEVRWVARAKARTAAWRYDPAAREVSPVDAASAVLAHVDPPSGRREAEPLPASRPVARSSRTAPRAPAAKAPAAAKAPKRVTATKAAKAPATTKVAAAPRPAAPRPAAPRPAAARTAAPRPAAAPAARPAAARSGAVRPAPSVRPAPAPRPAAASAAPASAKAARKGPSKAAPTVRAPKPVEEAVVAVEVAAPEVAPVEVAPVEVTPVAAPVPNGPPTLRVVPPADPEPEEPAAVEEPEAEPVEAPARVRRAAGQRASVPSWSDVLLGTAPVDPPRGGRSD